jgi:hypothetical protein
MWACDDSDDDNDGEICGEWRTQALLFMVSSHSLELKDAFTCWRMAAS